MEYSTEIEKAISLKEAEKARHDAKMAERQAAIATSIVMPTSFSERLSSALLVGGLCGVTMGVAACVAISSFDVDKSYWAIPVAVTVGLWGGVSAWREELKYKRKTEDPDFVNILQAEHKAFLGKTFSSKYHFDRVEQIIYDGLETFRQIKMPPLNQPINYNLPWRK